MTGAFQSRQPTLNLDAPARLDLDPYLIPTLDGQENPPSCNTMMFPNFHCGSNRRQRGGFYGVFSASTRTLHSCSTVSLVLFGMVLSFWGAPSSVCAAQVRLNEVLAHSNTPTIAGNTNTVDWIELINAGTEEIELSDWSLTDRADQPRRWVFPPDVTLLPGQRIIVVCGEDLPQTLLGTTPLSCGFSLGRHGDRVLLYSPTSQGGGLADKVEFGPQAGNFSLARIPEGTGDWTLGNPTPMSANSRTQLGDPSQLRINEWLASRSDGPDSFEIFNPQSLPVDLGGLWLSDNPKKKNKHVIPALSFIGTREFAYQQFIADNAPAEGPEHVSFTLDADGENLGLYFPNSEPIDQVTFSSQQTDVSEGRFPDGGTGIRRFPGTVSLGRMNLVRLPTLVINEVMSHADEPLEDSIELYNPGTESIDLGGWYLSDNLDRPRKFRIPEGTIAEPGKYVTFYKYQMQPVPGVLPGFSFNSAHGDEFYVFAADSEGVLTGEYLEVSFSSAPNGVPYGRWMTSTGPQFPMLEYVTFGTQITAASSPLLLDEYRTGKGAPNANPVVGPISISEIMYAPRSELGVDDANLEYVELQSVVDRPLTLFDPDASTNCWKISGEIQFAFPQGIVIPPRATLLLLPFDPATNSVARTAFEQRYGEISSLLAFGPFTGRLNNAGGTLELYRPDIPQFWFDPDFGFIPYIEVDRIQYRPQAPWPAAGLGTGNSLQRQADLGFGNDPTNWVAGIPSPGRLNSAEGMAGPLPTAILSASASQPQPGSQVELRISGENMGFVQWYWNGDALPGQTNLFLSLPSIDVRSSGVYSAWIANSFGSIHRATVLEVQQPPVITFGPSNRVASLGEPVVMVVGARGTPPFGYQWFRNGAAIPEGTNASFTLASQQVGNPDLVRVQVSNALGSTTTPEARIEYTIVPALVQQPTDQATFEGQPVTIAVTATGVEPLSYQWFKDGVAIEGETQINFQIPSTTIEDQGYYSVQVRNPHGQVTSRSSRLYVSSIPVISITPVKAVVKENENYMEFALYRTGYLGLPSSVGFGIAGSARWNIDYEPLPAGLRIKAGTISTNILVKLINNDIVDGSRTFTIILTNRYYDHKFGTASNATVTIEDDAEDISPLPTLKPEPAMLIVNQGESAEFRIPASSQPNLTYQWQLNNEDLPEETGPTLKLKRVGYAAGGCYRVRISNGREFIYTPLSELIIRPKIIGLNPTNGRAEVRFEGTVDKNYLVEATEDFKTWRTVGTMANASGVAVILHESSPPGRCFYRIQQLP